MKPFRFPLQALRTLREHKEETARESYARALRACEEAAALVESTRIELTGCWAALGKKLEAGVTSIDLLRAQAWCRLLELQFKERGRTLEQAHRTVDAVWKELMLATRERETLDRFHEKRRGAYNLEFQREEQKNLDEMAIQMFRKPQAAHSENHALIAR